MQIPSSSGLFGPSATKAASNAAAAGTASASAISGKSKLAAKSNDVVQQFMNYAKMDPMQRMRANILKSMGLSEDDLKNMTPDQQKAVEQKIAQTIQQELQKKTSQPGQIVNISA